MSLPSNRGISRHLVRQQLSQRFVLVLSVVAAAALISACGGGKKEAATQVAVKVNKEEISVHQINQVLQRQPGLRQEQVPAASKQVLEGLVDQELGVQQAVEQKLDRDPRIVMAIEAARRDILARSYFDKVAEAAQKPTADEIHQYYVSKPALFAERRVYSLQEVNIELPGDAAKRGEQAAQFRDVTSAAELVGRLKAAGVKYSARNVTQPAEGLPISLLDRLAKLQEGQSLAVGGPNGVSVIFVAGAKSAPVAEAAASQAITAFLTNDRKRKLVSEDIKRLRGAAQIQYMGQFAAGASSATVPAPDAAPATLPAEPASAALDGAALQKGLSGLK
jgi:EpsD family peptidyl-prolyl cis-trans isomerase